MATYHGPRCKICRRQGVKLFLKGMRCYTDKCAFERRAYGPGQHGQRRRRKPSDYGLQLKEKQKAKRLYGVLERQFRNYYAEADRQRGITGDNLVRLLERRLDNIVYRLGFAFSRSAARELVRHGHIQVNGRRVNRPGRLVRQGDKVSVRPSEKSQKSIRAALGEGGGPPGQEWLERDAERLAGTGKALPTAEDVQIPVETQLIIEACSR